MAEIKISQLPAITDITEDASIPIVQGGSTQRITFGNFLQNVRTDALSSYALTAALSNYTANASLTSTLAQYVLSSSLVSYTLNANLTSTLVNYQLITSTLTLNNLTANTITVTGIGVRMTSRPSFRVFGNSSTNWNVTSNTTGILNNNNFSIEHNQGNYLNTSTGVFTAPIDGLYQICLNARVSGFNDAMSQIVCYKQKGVFGEETILVMWEAAAACTADHFGVSTVANLTSGQTLGIYVTAGTINFDSNDSWSVTYLG